MCSKTFLKIKIKTSLEWASFLLVCIAIFLLVFFVFLRMTFFINTTERCCIPIKFHGEGLMHVPSSTVLGASGLRIIGIWTISLPRGSPFLSWSVYSFSRRLCLQFDYIRCCCCLPFTNNLYYLLSKVSVSLHSQYLWSPIPHAYSGCCCSCCFLNMFHHQPQ